MNEKCETRRERTGDLELYIPRKADGWFYVQMLSDPATMAYNAPWFPPDGCIPNAAEEWEDLCESWIGAEPERFYAFLRRRADGAFVGDVNFHYTPDRDWWDMGVVIYAPERGKGYGKQGLRLLADRAFRVAGISRLHNEFETTRDAAYRIHRAAGFRDLGVLDGLHQLELTRADYLQTHAGDEVLFLTEPTAAYTEQIRAYRAAFLASGDSMDGTAGLRRFADPGAWLRFVDSFKTPETTPEGRVPATQYLYVREADRKIVGMIQIRHCLNDYLRQYSGHIGYSVAPDERRKGYASRMLAEALGKCRELGLKEVLITCERNNEASRRTILKNGGVYESDVYEPDAAIWIERYRVPVP